MALQHNINGDLPLNAQNPPGSGFTYNGAGQSAHNYNHETQTSDGIDVGLQINHYQGPNYTPTGVESNGTVDYTVQAGVSPNNANRAEWSFNYSVDQIANNTLQGHNFELTLTKDGAVVLDLVSDIIGTGARGGGGGPAVSPHLVWEDKATGQVVIADDGHNTTGPLHVSQNSQNIAFYVSEFNNARGGSGTPAPGNDGNPFDAGHVYDITLAEVGIVGAPMVHDHITVV